MREIYIKNELTCQRTRMRANGDFLDFDVVQIQKVILQVIVLHGTHWWLWRYESYLK